MEWSDVQPLDFPASQSFLYVNQDAAHGFLYLLYDFPFRTTQIAPTDSVHIQFDTVSQDAGVPALEEYDIFIFGNGQIQVQEQGKPTPAGRISGAAGFGSSPNSFTPHLMAELQVPLTPGPPTAYSPDPLFWSSEVPPTPPPAPCVTQPGKIFSVCAKQFASIGATALAVEAAGASYIASLCTSGNISSCAPAESALMTGGFVTGLAAYYIDKFIANDPPGLNLTIPPDPNYTAIATPASYTLTAPLTGVPAGEATAFNALFTGLAELISVEQAGITSMARLEGAQNAGASDWVILQTEAAQNYAAVVGGLLDGLPALASNLAGAFKSAGAEFTSTSNDARVFLSGLSTNTLPAPVAADVTQALSALTQVGATSADQTQVLQLLTSTDPNAAAALGIGAFPQALTDTSVGTAIAQLGGSLGQSLISFGSLTQSFSLTLNGDYVAAGVGLRGGTAPNYGPPLTTGAINISGIPTGATVAKAFLYWGVLDNSLEASLGQMKFNGTSILGTLIGTGPDTCWGRTSSFTFRSDVTSLVNGNGTYTLTGIANGGNILPEGASLVVVYQLASLPLKTVILDDGNIAMPNGSAAGTATFGFSAAGSVSAKTTFIVGDGQEQQLGPATVIIEGTGGVLTPQGLFASNNGPLWDTDTIDISSTISAGGTIADVVVGASCLLWSAQALSVTAAPNTSPVTATAALVQANGSGDTVIDVRGLKTTDAPTIADQISFVVQSRTIQNPGTSGPALTTQLVTGLVNDGVISSSDAGTIQTQVLQTVVTPSGTPSISGKLASVTVAHSSNSEVDLTLSDIGTGNAVSAALSKLAFRTLSGSGQVTLVSPAVPVNVGNLAVGASATVKLFLNIPATVARFSITESGTMQDALGRSNNFSTSQQVFVH